MNKIQDGFYAGGDSYKPLVISSDRRSAASLSFVADRVLIRGMNGAQLVLDENSANGEITFRILSKADAEALLADSEKA